MLRSVCVFGLPSCLSPHSFNNCSVFDLNHHYDQTHFHLSITGQTEKKVKSFPAAAERVSHWSWSLTVIIRFWSLNHRLSFFLELLFFTSVHQMSTCWTQTSQTFVIVTVIVHHQLCEGVGLWEKTKLETSSDSMEMNRTSCNSFLSIFLNDAEIRNLHRTHAGPLYCSYNRYSQSARENFPFTWAAKQRPSSEDPHSTDALKATFAHLD